MNKQAPQFRLETLDILKALEELGVASKLDKNEQFSKQLDKIFETLVRRIYQEADELGGVKSAD